jgi:hypothetical protein
VAWQNAHQLQFDPSQQQHTAPEEADPSIIAFATKVAQLLMQEISEHMPARVVSVLTQLLQQQVRQQAADAAAAGKTFSTTATLQQLLPQLSQVAAHAAVLGPQLAAAEAAAASTARTPFDSSSAGQHTRFQLRSSQQQQQQQQCPSPGFERQQQQHLENPLPALRSTAAPNSPYLASNACRKLAFAPTAAAAAAAVGTTAGCPPYHQQQQQQQVWSGPQWGAVPTCSECGSTCE